jgi:hypothetical protein
VTQAKEGLHVVDNGSQPFNDEHCGATDAKAASAQPPRRTSGFYERDELERLLDKIDAE